MSTGHFASLTIRSSTGPRANFRSPPAERPSEPLGLEHDHVARRVLDQIVDVAPEDAAVSFDPLAPPAHDEEVHRLLADRVQDDLVNFVPDLDDRARVDAHAFADPGQSL